MGLHWTKPVDEVFWAKVAKGEGCWTWKGFIRSNGYGGFSWYREGRAKVYRAHRIAWELTHGPIPSGLYVCHTCDNRLCVRPDHLWLGTAKDNAQDAARKGRLGVPGRPKVVKQARVPRPPKPPRPVRPALAPKAPLPPPRHPCGERGAGARLTNSQATEIRAAAAAGVTKRELAERLGVDRSTVSRVLNYVTYREAP